MLDYIFLFFIYYLFKYLRRNGRLLDEVVLHVTLEVEVGELVGGSERKELGEARIGVNLASILLVLETLLADVGVNLLAHLSARHLGSNGLSEELGKLVADTGGLDEPRGLPVSRGLPLLGVLLRALELAGEDLLEGLVIALHGSEESSHLLELGTELLNLNGSGGLDGSSGINLNDGGSRNGGGGRRGRNRGGSGSLLRRTRLSGGNLDLGRGGRESGRGGGSGLLIGLSGSDHFGLYYVIPLLFK